MVGRLVEQQHVGRLKQQLGQFYSHAPTSRELACRAIEVLALESQAQQRLLHVLLKVCHVYGIEFL